jgi:phage regulator Rha-like protein
MPEEITHKESNLIENRIFHIRGVPVMLDSDLAKLYGVPPKRLNEQVQRNYKRFPNHFMFKLTPEEWESLRSQIATLEKGRGQHKKYFPFVFTEQGVAMLSAVLKSDTAINVSIQIIDAFIKLRKQTFQLEWFNYRLDKMEEKLMVNDHKFHKIFHLLEKADPIPTQGIFFNGQIFDAYKFASDIIRSAK